MLLIAMRLPVLLYCVFSQRGEHLEVLGRQFEPFFVGLIEGWIIKLLEFFGDPILTLKEVTLKQIDVS